MLLAGQNCIGKFSELTYYFVIKFSQNKATGSSCLHKNQPAQQDKHSQNADPTKHPKHKTGILVKPKILPPPSTLAGWDYRVYFWARRYSTSFVIKKSGCGDRRLEVWLLQPGEGALPLVQLSNSFLISCFDKQEFNLFFFQQPSL